MPPVVRHDWPLVGPLTMLLPLDGSKLAEAGLAAAERLSQSFGAELNLLRVVETPPYPIYGDGNAFIPTDEDLEVEQAEQYLAAHADRLRQAGRYVDTQVVVGDPTRVISETAVDLDVDVVVMATHGLGGLSRLLLGSITTGILRHSLAPLLLVRPAAPGAAHGSGEVVLAEAANEEEVREVSHVR